MKLTPEHPLLTSRGWVRADGVKAGDNLLQIHEPIALYTKTQDGPPDVVYHAVAVTSTERVFYEGPVFNFSVEEDESYLANGYVAHNCGCELVEVPEGWGFSDDGELQPDVMLKKADRLEIGFAKSETMMTHRGAVPDDTVSIRISDPQMRAVIEQVVEQCPPEIFDSKVGVTLITNDIPRVQNPLEEHDFAYWTANEIRVMNTLPIERVPRVIRHELGHSLNVHLMNKLGSVEEVRKWHDKLWKVSKEEGWVSDYANKLPIENAAEVTRMYLFEKPKLMLHYPKQFAFVHRYYRDIFRRNKT